MPIRNFNVGENEGESIDMQDAMNGGLPQNKGAVDIDSAPRRLNQETGTARDIPQMEIDGSASFREGGTPAPEERMSDSVEDLIAEIQEMKSERGRYGREVVGPLREENRELRDRLAALEGRFEQNSQSQQAPQTQAPAEPSVQDIAVALYGEDVDLEDPQVLRDARAHKTALQLTMGTQQQMVAALREEISALKGELGTVNTFAQSGVSREQVQAAIKANPELADLPVDKVVSFVARNLNANGQGGAQPRPSGGAVPSYADPNLVVDGGSNVFANPGEASSAEAELRKLGEIRQKVGFGRGKPSVADIQAAEMNKLFGSGRTFQ